MIQESRTTNETDIQASIGVGRAQGIVIQTPIPFFSHLLHSLCFHGDFSANITAKGDTEVDPHHLIEDAGIVLGSCIRQWYVKNKNLRRFGHAVIPMDDALCEATVDLSGRPYLHYEVNFSQSFAGTFFLDVLREFFVALSNSAQMNFHLSCRHGINGHHIAEAAFKASGRALSQALEGGVGDIPSTKGRI